MLYKKWQVNRPEKEKTRELSGKLGVGGLLGDVLASRGHTSESAAALLEEGFSFPDPMRMREMDRAVQRIRRAVSEDEPMVIYGDYDVDGITATTLLYTYLESLGAQVYYKLPSRSVDDYGLVPSVVEQVAQRGITLIITVDNGTSALEAAQRAKELGVDIVMTDHHLPPDTLPEVAALVNPCLEEDESVFGILSGVGVAFMLVAALEECPPEELISHFGDLVAVGTVADVMKLTGVNRALVKSGLEVLQDTQHPGLSALIERCGWKDKAVTAENISYGLAPRLNAAGRMDDPTDALDLLLAESEEQAQPILEGLLAQNTARQKAEQEILSEITQQVDNDPELQRARVLVVWGDGWHQGVIGIVSSRLVDRYAKPAIIITLEGEEGRGSGRSLHGFSLHTAISACEDLLTRYGGHDLAAGLSIPRKNLEAFRRRINECAQKQCPEPVVPVLKADAPLALVGLHIEAVRELEKLAPFGSGNPTPKFFLENVQLEAVYPISEGKHCRLRLQSGEESLLAVYFGVSPQLLAYKPGDRVDALVTLSVYEGKYEPQVSARVVELRPAGMGGQHVEQSALFELFSSGCELSDTQRETLFPSREETAAVYRALRDEPEGVSFMDLRPLIARLGEDRTGRILSALAALEELGLVSRDKNKGRFVLAQVKEKKDLRDSTLLRKLEVS
ncbi:single-stranded-DNA-specific exonuclease RecJ [Ruminococcaceae bacterium OttesenSCG-928-I18]|nr:single-stranded-DNA-specific exonuclease RecJ [Ruminococcaceae bacterium OttesenSCG-928-I18]